MPWCSSSSSSRWRGADLVRPASRPAALASPTRCNTCTRVRKLKAVEAWRIPSELAPLVDAINADARRLDLHSRAQGIFIQNAAHQLRTPLTLLNTQVSYAVRATDSAAQAESLAAIRQTVQQSVRLVNQLLTLSAAEAHNPDETTESPIELDAVVRQVLEDLSGQAQAKGIDLGFEMAGAAPTVVGHPVALREIVMNLLDNAIR